MRPPVAPDAAGARLARLGRYSLGAVVALALTVQLLLPAVVEAVASAGVRTWLGQGSYTVRVAAAPRYRMLLGEFDRVEVTGRDLRRGSLPLHRLVATLEDVRVDLRSLLLEHALRLSRARTVHVRVELTGDDLAAYLSSSGLFAAVDVGVDAAGFTIQAQLPPDRGGARLRLQGGFEPAEPGAARVRLQVRRVWVNDRQVPPFLLQQMVPALLDAGLVVDLTPVLPVPLSLRRVGAQEGLLFLEGDVDTP